MGPELSKTLDYGEKAAICNPNFGDDISALDFHKI